MHITWKELTVNPKGVDFDDLLSEWRWLVEDSFRPVLISSLGDLFLRHSDGRIFRLDTGWGQLSEVAPDADEFQRRMVQPENASDWFSPHLVGDLLTSGARLEPGQCFGYKTPPVVGGQPEPDNFEPTDLSVHFSVLGQIHQQIKDLPPGAAIDEILIEEPDEE